MGKKIEGAELAALANKIKGAYAEGQGVRAKWEVAADVMGTAWRELQRVAEAFELALHRHRVTQKGGGDGKKDRRGGVGEGHAG
jgi:hypothetical protein